MEDTIALFSHKDIEQLRRDGGSAAWRIDPVRAAKAKYVLVCANTRHPEADLPFFEHGGGWLLGKITGIRPVGDRYVVEFSEFTIVCTNDPRTPGSRNPVRYTSIAEIGIWPDAFGWTTLAACGEDA